MPYVRQGSNNPWATSEFLVFEKVLLRLFSHLFRARADAMLAVPAMPLSVATKSCIWDDGGGGVAWTLPVAPRRSWRGKARALLPLCVGTREDMTTVKETAKGRQHRTKPRIDDEMKRKCLGVMMDEPMLKW